MDTCPTPLGQRAILLQLNVAQLFIFLRTRVIRRHLDALRTTMQLVWRPETYPLFLAFPYPGRTLRPCSSKNSEESKKVGNSMASWALI